MQSTTRTPFNGPIAVAGATGKQGGAVVSRLLERGHPVRALTRNPSKPAAKALERSGVEVVQVDLEDRTSIDAALVGAAAVFSVQDFLEAGVEAELRQGMNLTEAAAQARVGHVVYSGASTMDRNTGVPHLDSKWRIEQRVRELDIPWTVFRPAAFMDNWAWERESIERDGVIRYPLRADTVYRQIAVADIAAMVVTAFEDRLTWASQIMPLTGEMSTMTEIAETFSRVLGRPIRYEQLDWETCKKEQGEELTAMYRYFDTFGMDGDPRYLKRWHRRALSLEAFLRSEAWNKPSASAA